jgi:hypothetical protein
MRIAAALLILYGLVFSGTATAHERSESTSHWTLADGELHGIVTIRMREITRLTLPGDSYSSLPGLFAAHVERSLTASVDDVPCSLRQTPAVLESEPGYVRVNVAMHCSPGQVLTLKVDLLFAVAPSHHHFLYVETSGASREAILSASAPVMQLRLHDAIAANPTQLLQFVAMGLEHIATGIDHLAFLLALLIGARTIRQQVAVVTGFTLGHSLTLSLAVLGIVQANRGAIECLIGLTIALAAARNLIRTAGEGQVAALGAVAITGALLWVPAELRPDLPASLIASLAVAAGGAVWLAGRAAADPGTVAGPSAAAGPTGAAGFTLAAGFGLIHGLGFAGALQDLDLPRTLLLPSVAGFNIGVEIGQLLIVMLATLTLAAVRSVSPGAGRRSQQAAVIASAALLAAGLAWFLTRAVV